MRHSALDPVWRRQVLLGLVFWASGGLIVPFFLGNLEANNLVVIIVQPCVLVVPYPNLLLGVAVRLLGFSISRVQGMKKEHTIRILLAACHKE